MLGDRTNRSMETKMIESVKRSTFATAACVVVCIASLGTGCSSKSKASECADTETSEPAKAVVPDKSESDWCHACVLGPKGYASCQKVYAVDERESRDSLRKRAKDRACTDAGYKEGECPAGAIGSLVCKGAALPKAMPSNEGVAQAFKQILEHAQSQGASPRDSDSSPKDIDTGNENR